MVDLSELRREVIEQIQMGNHQSYLIARNLNSPEEAVVHVIQVLAGEDWFMLDGELGKSVGVRDIRPGFYEL